MGDYSLWERLIIWLSQRIYPAIWREYYKKCETLQIAYEDLDRHRNAGHGFDLIAEDPEP